MTTYNEDSYEQSLIELFEGLGYTHIYGPSEDSRDYRSPLYDSVLEKSLRAINPDLPEDAIEDALYKLRNFENGSLVQKNERFMDYLQNGLEVKYMEGGQEASAIAYLVDYKNIETLSSSRTNGPTSKTVTKGRILSYL